MSLITRLSHQTVLPSLYSCASHRCASVLASMPPKPVEDQPQQPQQQSSQPPNPLTQTAQQTLDYIVTPASAPLTTPSNNAFHPDYIPKPVKARLTLDELKEVLDTSKTLLNHLQSEYLEHQTLQDTMVELTKEQQALLKTLRKNACKLNNNDDENS
ncbi:hypothetical protein BDA99DRAFT_516182 [Phascolomyces articulosus]|uniref:Uncharacterized protein n=1 Tax=Phascolomyces articulosus TaxID=60185 RepID=A0AAD5K623_9FUNG|nr:hypothetical protein BDA99DRAFT_516182 [Phascolomyces articulosus]